MFLNRDEVKKSYYETLGIAKTAADTEIKRAYFGLVRKYPPDRFPEEFKEIRAAYETLMDRKKRAQYDAIGEIPPSVASFFHEAQWMDRFGRYEKAAELYQLILKSHPELDNVREEYACCLEADKKTGKAGEVWEELCRRHPDSPHYARQLCENYLDRGWNKKALVEVQRALDLDRSCIDTWSLLISCSVRDVKKGLSAFDEMQRISLKALDAIKAVKEDEWKKIHIYAFAFVSSGIKKIDTARGYLREIIRLVREGGRDGQEEGQTALHEIFELLPVDCLAVFYPEFREMAAVLPDMRDKKVRRKLEDMRLYFQIEDLLKKKFHEIFHDLFTLLIIGFEDVRDEIELLSMEYIILDDKRLFDPQIQRLKEEFPELYELHSSFFNDALRVRDPEKMLHQRAKKINKLKRKRGVEDDEPDPEPPQIIRRAQPKVGRNDPCPCGSGKKYKKCCGA